MPAISVAICTHNPRLDFLSRTLDALKAQKMPRTDWEFLIIDNASPTPVATSVKLDWHPNARIVVEPELGIASARLRAMREFTGDLLIFFDDDNIMSEDYLQRCADLFATRPDLGAVSGCLMPEYEVQPPDWFLPYEGCIAVRRITESTWSNFHDSRSEPVTAGMCLRRPIAEAHIKAAKDNPFQMVLGSRGHSLLRGEDVALAKTALKLGYSIGQFAELQLIHIIPKRRVEPEYFFSLYRHQAASGHLISWVDSFGRTPINLPWRVVLKSAYRFIKGNWLTRRLVKEEFRGYFLAKKIASDWNRDEAQRHHA